MLDQIATELNGRPRKTLNWRTPAEALDALLSDSQIHQVLRPPVETASGSGVEKVWDYPKPGPYFFGFLT